MAIARKLNSNRVSTYGHLDEQITHKISFRRSLNALNLNFLR